MLWVLTMTRGTRAAGVAFTQNGRKRVIKASRQVVISSGAFGTPGIVSGLPFCYLTRLTLFQLERSGLGDRSVLQKAGVNVVSDLPGVGENLIGIRQNHPWLYALTSSDVQ